MTSERQCCVKRMMRGSRHIAGSWVCRVFRFGVVCVVFIVCGCRKEKNERHFAWLLISLLVSWFVVICYMCVRLFLFGLVVASFSFPFAIMVEPFTIKILVP